MIIEMNKKYKTRKDGSRYCNAYKSDCDLVEDKEVKEVKEDWKILVEHFENKGEQVFIVADGEICICTNMKQCERSQDYCKSLLVTKNDNYYYYYNIKKEKIKLAKLEDCKKFILEK